jgi:hypothetical protein
MPAVHRSDSITAVTESRFPAYKRYRIAFCLTRFL